MRVCAGQAGTQRFRQTQQGCYNLTPVWACMCVVRAHERRRSTHMIVRNAVVLSLLMSSTATLVNVLAPTQVRLED